MAYLKYLSEQSNNPNLKLEDGGGLLKGIPVYLMIFIFSLIFQVALAWDAVS